jgi:hypothetical protein
VARRQQPRRRFQPPKSANRDEGAAQAALESNARRLLALHPPAAIEGLVRDLTVLHDEADLAASDQPSPNALYNYRRARHELSVAQAALALLNRDSSLNTTLA